MFHVKFWIDDFGDVLPSQFCGSSLMYVCIERVLTHQPAVLFHRARCSALTKKNVTTALSVTPVSCALLFLLCLNGTSIITIIIIIGIY